MPALELIAGQATAPSTTLTSLTMHTGNSNVVRSFNNPFKAHLLTAWAYANAAAIFRIKSPRMHDQAQGLRLRVPADCPEPLLPMSWGDDQVLESQDTLTLEIAGSATGGEIESGYALIYYEDLPGVNARFIDVNGLRARAKNQAGIEVSLNTGTAGGWSGQRVLTYSFDTLKSDTDYAVLGATMDAICGAVRMFGSDTGNLGIGVPGFNTHPFITANFFQLLAVATGSPVIPVISGSNKGSIYVDASQDQGGVDVNVTWILQELAKG